MTNDLQSAAIHIYGSDALAIGRNLIYQDSGLDTSIDFVDGILPQVNVLLLHPDAKMPARGRKGDIGYDVRAVEKTVIPFGGFMWVSTGIAMSFPKYLWYEVKPRSGFSLNRGIFVHPGTIEHTYTGELKIGILNLGGNFGNELVINKSQRIAQILWHKRVDVTHNEVDKLQETERGAQGFGSSGL